MDLIEFEDHIDITIARIRRLHYIDRPNIKCRLAREISVNFDSILTDFLILKEKIAVYKQEAEHAKNNQS